MALLSEHIASQDWQRIYEDLHTQGYAIIPNFLSDEWCHYLRQLYYQDTLYRKTVVMARHGFGLGEYRYFAHPLPDVVRLLQSHLYPYLLPVAQTWADNLSLGVQYPLRHDDFINECQQAGQHLPTPLILRYEQGGYNTLHQDLYGDVYFPLQALFVLSQHGQDYTGGEFVLTEQRPRAQSRPMVLTPNQGDMVIFATNFRPRRSTKGYHKVTLRHGVSQIKQGERMAMGIIFHHAVS